MSSASGPDGIAPSDSDARGRGGELLPRWLGAYWFSWGAIPLVLLAVQLVTGLVLALHYQPGADSAYESVRTIAERVPYGWYLRGLHRWAASLLVLTIVLHLLRVLLSAAHRQPRHLTWLGGFLLLLCTVAAGFTGQALTGERGGTEALTLAGALLADLPAVGGALQQLLLAGHGVTARTLDRVYAWHAVGLPVLGVALLLGHLALVRAHGLSDALEGAPDATPTPWREHAQRLIVATLWTLLLLNVLAALDPGALGPPSGAVALSASAHTPATPWYLYPVVRWVRLLPGPAAARSGIALLLVAWLWPFIDRWMVQKLKLRAANEWFGALAVASVLTLALWEVLDGL